MNYAITPQQARAELAKRELSNRRLLDFILYTFEGYKANWHHELLIEKLEAIERGELKRLIVSMPPRHGKSEIISNRFPAWYLGRNPDKSIITSSYGLDLARDFGEQVRNLVASPEYRNIFPQINLAEDSQAKDNWKIEGKRGRYVAVGVGGAITGKGADVFIIDDPVKNRKDADSPVVRDGVWKWYTSTARTRLAPGGAIIVVMTRWHDDDLVGRLLISESAAEWDILTLPAIATTAEPHREAGDALWAVQYPLTELHEIKRDIGPYDWSALYQQNPVDEASQEFKREWFKYRTIEEIEAMKVRKFATIDTALTQNATSDFTGVTRNYVNDKNEWHLRSERYRINSKEIIDLIFMLHGHGFETIGIEEGAFTHAIKPFLDDEMRKRGQFPHIVPLKHGGTMKETRIRGLVPRYQTGTVYHIKGFCEDLEEELLRFPKSTHDDCADSAAYQSQVAAPPNEIKHVYVEPEPIYSDIGI